MDSNIKEISEHGSERSCTAEMNVLSWFDTGKIKLHCSPQQTSQCDDRINISREKKKIYIPTVLIVRLISLIPESGGATSIQKGTHNPKHICSLF